MAKEDKGEGAVLGFRGRARAAVMNAYRWGRNADNRHKVSKQDDPKNEKLKGVPLSMPRKVASEGVKFYS